MDKNTNNGIKVLKALETLLFLSPAKQNDVPKDDKSYEPEDIKNRVLLKIERAEIMSAMMEMRNSTDSDETINK